MEACVLAWLLRGLVLQLVDRGQVPKSERVG